MWQDDVLLLIAGVLGGLLGLLLFLLVEK